ncbi:beta-glucoside-specific PTS transporter subunit IIABC [Granulicatella adiacens]|uniref:beta-glucoside-specific PTS transporter subunit IIABC n=1 Tax=uncultured Granulicatella sp. TaxID=316089 RepID=UPI002805588B|nr:beta-glucoside-specific PTS transporter subunit IIABC [uncultured Granulicatella sp.]
MSYQELAKEILSQVGGKENIQQLTHCATRLRFVLNDNSKANTDALKKTKGVVGVAEAGGQYQVIIGSDVQSVYRPLMELTGLKEDASANAEEPHQKPLAKLLSIISGIFTPILPIITAAGMIKAILSILVVFKIVTTKDQNYQVLNFIGDAGFYFLPVFLGGTAAKQFKTNTYLGMLMGATLLHPTFTAMVANFKETGAGIELFGIPFSPVGYSSTVIPVILGVWFMSYVERFADRISPKAIKFFSVPLITALITSIVMFSVLGPIGSIIGQYLGDFFRWLEEFGPWVVPTVVGIFSPFLVMTGTHYGLVSIGINNRLTLGYDTVVQPGMLASNVAQGGAALAIAFKTKDTDKKALATSAGITAVCGITEPALYGVTLQNRAAMIGTMVAGGIVGFFLGIMNARNFTGGSPGLLTIMAYVGENTFYYLYVAIAGLVMSVALSFIITYFLYKDEEGVELTSEEVVPTEALAAPVAGKVVPLAKVEDEIFSSEMLGKGIAILPEENIVKSPVKGEIVTIFDTQHAIGLKTDDDVEVLIHIGIDTVNLKGQHFNALAKVGDRVEVGTPIMEVDFAAVKEAGYDIITPVIVTNTAAFKNVLGTDQEHAQSGDLVVTIER